MAALRPTRLVLAALLSVAVLGACATVATAFPSSFDVVVAEFSGDGYASSHNGDYTSFAAGAFWEEDSMPFNTEGGQLTIMMPNEVDSLFGISFWANGGGGVKPCSSEYQLTQALHPGTNSSAGPRFWTHTDWSSLFGPNPGKNGVLVSAEPYFGDFARVSGSCNPGNGPMSALSTKFVHLASCVVQHDGECSATIRVNKHTASCGVNCSATYAGSMTLKVRRISIEPLDPIPQLILDTLSPDLPYLDTLPLLPIGGPYRDPPPVIIRPPNGGPGELDETVYIAKQPVLKLKGKLKAGTRTKLQPTLIRAGALAVQRITVPTRLTARVVFTPVGKPARTVIVPLYVLPKQKITGGGGGTTPTITSVAFTGSQTNPTVVIRGKNFGTKPPPSPAQHPSGLNGCPTLAGDTGYDYGTSLYLAVPSKNWSGGRARPAFKEVDCLDLVVTKFTQTEVDFHFGPFYKSAYPQFALTAGLQVQVAVNGATANAIVKY